MDMDVKADEKMQTTKCIRCALERGSDPFSAAGKKCIWKNIGTMCPDYDKRPDIDSIASADIPDDETQIIRSQMKLLAEKSRFMKADQLVEASRTMGELYKCLMENKTDSSDIKGLRQ